MIKRQRILLTITAISLCLATSANSQTNFLPDFDRYSQDYHYSWDFYGGGARARGMGNAYTALADDVFGVSWNPAGISHLEEIFIGFDWQKFSPQGSYDLSYNVYGASDIATPNKEITASLSDAGGTSNFFRDFAVSAPVQIKNQNFVFAISASRAFDNYNSFTDKIFPHSTSPGSTDLTISREGYLTIWNIGLASQFSEKLSVGVSMNIQKGRSTVVQMRQEIYTQQNLGSGQIADISYDILEVDSFSISGSNFTLGAIYELSDNTRLGLTAKTPFKIDFSDDVRMERILRLNGATYPQGGITDTLIFADRASKVEMPLMLTLGVAHNWSDKLLSSIDIEYRGYSGMMISVLDSTIITSSGNKETLFHDEPTGWNNVLQVRVGTEYTLNTRLGKLPLRVGFGYLPQPYGDIADYNFEYSNRSTPIMPVGLDIGEPVFTNYIESLLGNQDIDLFMDNSGDQVVATSFSLGVGLSSPQRRIDISYTYTSSTQSVFSSSAQQIGALRNADGALVDFDGLEVSDANAIIYDPLTSIDPQQFLRSNESARTAERSTKDHRIAISFIGYF